MPLTVDVSLKFTGRTSAGAATDFSVFLTAVPFKTLPFLGAGGGGIVVCLGV